MERPRELGKVALLHVTPGLDGVSRAANECERGLLPAEPTICASQPTAVDPSRAPPGKAILWLQLPEAPRFRKGDAAEEIAISTEGGWSEAVREAFDRAESLLSRHIEDFRGHMIARKTYSPADLEQMNVNLIGGDPYGGYCGVDQFFLWRPFAFRLITAPIFAASTISGLRPILARALAAGLASCSPIR